MRSGFSLNTVVLVYTSRGKREEREELASKHQIQPGCEDMSAG